MEQSDLYENSEEEPGEAERLGLDSARWKNDPELENKEKPITNFCNTEGPMSVCTECADSAMQKSCGFYEKSSGADKCMHLVMGENCDSADAQHDDKERKKAA